jgi:hypothetical protein
VSQTEQWVFPHHPWTGISHDDPDLFAAIALVAMNRALGTGRFFSAKSAPIQTQTGIVHQAFAIAAQVVAMVSAAIDVDHCFNGLEFTGEARVDLMRSRGFHTGIVQDLRRRLHLTHPIYQKRAWEVLMQIKLSIFVLRLKGEFELENKA